MPGYRKLWIQCVVAYTCAGLVSACIVGAVLGVFGRLVVGPVPLPVRLLNLTLLSLVLGARECGWITFPIPVRRRQTEKAWANEFGLRAAAAMWGFDIGTGLSTWVHYGGFWAIVGAIVAVGDARYGVALMGSYWLGRALTVLASPWISGTCWEFSTFLSNLQLLQPTCRSMNALGLAWSALAASLMVPGARATIAWIVDGFGKLGWLYISYILLLGLTLIPALLLHKVLRELAWLLREYDRRRQNASMWVGPVQWFSAPVLGTEKTITSLDLLGDEAILMFVRPEDGAQEQDKQLRTSAHALSHKGSLYIVCSGSAEGCGQVSAEFQFSGHERSRIPVLLDEGGAIARAFRVNHTPMAFRLDATARIVGFGQQLASSPAQ